jgi:hypothetical protein
MQNYVSVLPRCRVALGCVMVLTFMAVFLASQTVAQQPNTPKPEPDTLILVDGEKLIGQFQRSTGSSVTFKSDLAGEITVDWSKVQELRSANQFAVIQKGVRLRNKKDIATSRKAI